MSVESAFQENCGPDVELQKAEVCGNIIEFTFLFHEKIGVLGVMVGRFSHDEYGAVAGQRAKEWADRQKEKADV